MSRAQQFIKNDYKYGFSMPENYEFKSKKGLNEQVIREISRHKSEPEWMLEFRLKSYEFFKKRPMPSFGADLSGIDFDDIYYYIKPIKDKKQSWEELPPEIKETYDKIGMPEAEKKYLAGVSAQYECVTGDTCVYSAYGSKCIRDLRTGEYVYALNETTKKLELQKITGVVCKGKRPVYTVRVAGRELTCTMNHPFLKLNYKKDPSKPRGTFSTEWEYLEALSEGDYVAIVKDIPDTGHSYALPDVSLEVSFEGKNQVKKFNVRSHLFFTRRQKKLSLPKISSPSLMWLIGLYIGDGYINKTNKDSERKVLNIAIPQTDKLLREKLAKTLQSVFGYTLSKTKDPYRITVYATPIVRLFEQLGLVGNARTKKIPRWIFGLPREEKLALIGGYIDSDGYIRKGVKNNDVWITSVNRKLLSDTQILGLSCSLHITGIHSFKYHPDVINKERVNTGYRLQITGDLSSLKKYSYKVSRDFRGLKYYHNYNSHHKSSITTHTSDQLGYARITHIEAVEKEMNVYDIKVEGHHNFIANAIVVHNSEVVYKSLNEKLDKLGVIFTDMDTALCEHPEMVKKYFGSVIPQNDNKFAALNSAVWSGGSFLYIPPGVKVEMPLQAYFRINAANMGQFERTLIIADEGSYVHYVEGCTAPIYSTDSLHAAVVEIIVKPDARLRYTTVQNWSNNVYNLVTKRMKVWENAVGEWIDCNLGSKITMKYPACWLMGEGAHGEVLSIVHAGKGQHQDAGAKMIHVAANTTSKIISKSISQDGGRTSYRGLVRATSTAKNTRSKVVCDALLIDDESRSDTYPDMNVRQNEITIEHEASVSKIGEEQLFYLQSRGIGQEEAESMIVNGFIEPIAKELPLEYAVELNRLVQLRMEGSVG